LVVGLISAIFGTPIYCQIKENENDKRDVILRTGLNVGMKVESEEIIHKQTNPHRDLGVIEEVTKHGFIVDFYEMGRKHVRENEIVLAK
jgi:hypothetical protein